MAEQGTNRYERFTIVSFADPVVLNLVEELRRKIPPRLAVMPAHVTVKGSFVNPTSLRAVTQCIEYAAAEAAPLQVQVEGLSAGSASIGLRIAPSGDLAALHDRLFYGLQDMVQDVYGDQPGSGYHPHMTVLYGLSAQERERAPRLLSALERVKRLELGEVSLVGRVGDAASGRWEVVRSCPMGKSGCADRG